ncbi:hypothetical protein BRPE64_CCDS00860 [Caballeronia insecticola]|uniref:Uncharacterized protein n=1 Tax=Caballeronia insecticola TaxID=758793 RepID=R4WNP3_9BURK|nr:hypothetical protein BRPE64_CCDS00860 [Caballeronia insecticola]
MNAMQRLGYPARTIIVFAAALALAVPWLVHTFGHAWLWLRTAAILLFALVLAAWRTRRTALRTDHLVVQGRQHHPQGHVERARLSVSR